MRKIWLVLLVLALVLAAHAAAAQEEATQEEQDFQDLAHDDPGAAIQQDPVRAFDAFGSDPGAWTPEQKQAAADYFKTATPAQFDKVKGAATAYFESAGNFKGTEGENYVNYVSHGAVHLLLSNEFAQGMTIKGDTITKGTASFTLTGAATGTTVEPVKDGLKITVPGKESTPLTVPTGGSGQPLNIKPRADGSFDITVPDSQTQFIINPDTAKSFSVDRKTGTVLIDLQSGQSVRLGINSARLVDAHGGYFQVLSPTDRAAVVELRERGTAWDKITAQKDTLLSIYGTKQGVEISGKFEMLTRTASGNALRIFLPDGEKARDGSLTAYIGTGEAPLTPHANFVQVRLESALPAGQMPIEVTGRAGASFDRPDGSTVTVIGNVYTAKVGADDKGNMVVLRGPSVGALREEAARKAVDELKRYNDAKAALEQQKQQEKTTVAQLKQALDSEKQLQKSGQITKDEYKAFEKQTNDEIKAMDLSIKRQSDVIKAWGDGLPRSTDKAGTQFTADAIVNSKLNVDIASETIAKGGSIASVTLTAPAGADALEDIKAHVMTLSLAGAQQIPFNVQWGEKRVTATVDPSDPTRAIVRDERGKEVAIMRATMAIQTTAPAGKNTPAIVVLDGKGNQVLSKVTLSFDAKGMVQTLGGEWGDYLAGKTKSGNPGLVEIDQYPDGKIAVRGDVRALEPFLGKVPFYGSVASLVEKQLATDLQGVGGATLGGVRSYIDGTLNNPATGGNPIAGVFAPALVDAMKSMTRQDSPQLQALMRMEKLTNTEIIITPPKAAGDDIPATLSSMNNLRIAASQANDDLETAVPGLSSTVALMPKEDAINTIRPVVDAMNIWGTDVRATALNAIREGIPSVSVSFDGVDKKGAPIHLQSDTITPSLTPQQTESLYREAFLGTLVDYMQGRNPAKETYALYQSNTAAWPHSNDAMSIQFSATMLSLQQRAQGLQNVYRQSAGMPNRPPIITEIK